MLAAHDEIPAMPSIERILGHRPHVELADDLMPGEFRWYTPNLAAVVEEVLARPEAQEFVWRPAPDPRQR